MDDRYIFSVGRPDLRSKSVDHIHAQGLKAGLLLSTTVKNINTSRYDLVIPIDFKVFEQELYKLEDYKNKTDGLICTYESYIVARARLGEFLSAPALSQQSALRCTDKQLMRQAFTSYDPTITPRFATVDSIQSAVKFTELVGYPVIIKPTNLVKSLLVMRCNNTEELIQNVAYATRTIDGLYKKYNVYHHTPQIIIEEFIAGPMYSVAAFTDAAGEPYICPGITQLTSAQAMGRDDNYLYSRVLPASINAAVESEIIRVSEAGIKALGLASSPAHIEVIVGAQGVKLVEIGARVGGYRQRMYHQAFGIDITELEIKSSLGKLQHLKLTKPSQSVAVFELFPTVQGSFKSVEGLKKHLKAQYFYYALKAKKGQQVGPAKDGFKASLIIIISEKDPNAFAQLRQSIDDISIEVGL